MLATRVPQSLRGGPHSVMARQEEGQPLSKEARTGRRRESLKALPRVRRDFVRQSSSLPGNAEQRGRERALGRQLHATVTFPARYSQRPGECSGKGTAREPPGLSRNSIMTLYAHRRSAIATGTTKAKGLRENLEASRMQP